MNGLMTEREWRKQYLRQTKARPSWWGAQYLLPTPPKRSLKQDRAFQVFLMLLSLIIAVLMPVFFPFAEQEYFEEAQAVVATSALQPRSVRAISYTRPNQLVWREHTFTSAELSRGKMLLLDEEHPVPPELPPPNTFSIAAYGKGMVPVSSLSIQSGQETILALRELFGALRQKGVSGLSVQQGTLSISQQKAIRLARLRELMRTHPPMHAVEKVVQETDTPSTGEMLREYTIELRFQAQDGGVDTRMLQETAAGQILLQTAWRFGFVRTASDAAGNRAYRFRYVGTAHAMAMTFLDLSFENYLQWLHEKGMLTIYEEGQPKYLILCKPILGTHVSFHLPQGAAYEASLDNLGYAIVACTL